MTIDTYYLLDEIEMMQQVIEGLALPILHREPIRTEYLHGLLDELRSRREYRRNLFRKKGTDIGEVYDDFRSLEDSLRGLRELPEPEVMKAILVGHLIETRAVEMKIRENLIRTAISSTEHLTSADYQRMSMEDNGPFLPEPLRTQWKEELGAIQLSVQMAEKHGRLLSAYERYLQTTVDRWALESPLAKYNEGNDDGTHKDTFWVHTAKIARNVMAEPGEPTHMVEILFIPRQVINSENTIVLYDRRKNIFSASLTKHLPANDHPFVAVEFKGTVQEGLIRVGTGRTETEAYVNLVAPAPERPPGRVLTPEERREVAEMVPEPHRRYEGGEFGYD